MSLLELLRFLENRLEVPLRYTHLPWRQSDQKFFVADNGKAERLLHWTPRTPHAPGIEDTLRWEMQLAEAAQ